MYINASHILKCYHILRHSRVWAEKIKDFPVNMFIIPPNKYKSKFFGKIKLASTYILSQSGTYHFTKTEILNIVDHLQKIYISG